MTVRIFPTRIRFFALAGLALAAAGCAGLPAALPTSEPTLPAAISTAPAPVEIPPADTAVSVPVVSTAVGMATSGPAVTSMPLEGSTPTATGPLIVPTSGAGLVIGRENSGQTVLMHVGERFVLTLGTQLEWTVTVSDQTVLHRVVNITPLVGSQGVYEALSPGSTVLNAVGDAACRKSTPPCMVPSFMFTLNVTVVP
ncbi:MAG TPA: hypothetical protein VF813_03120 [Anaerolineaceae bacterium]